MEERYRRFEETFDSHLQVGGDEGKIFFCCAVKAEGFGQSERRMGNKIMHLCGDMIVNGDWIRTSRFGLLYVAVTAHARWNRGKALRSNLVWIRSTVRAKLFVTYGQFTHPYIAATIACPPSQTNPVWPQASIHFHIRKTSISKVRSGIC